MPILQKETEMYPDDLFEMPFDSAPWQVAHVRSRQEKLLARFLEKHDKPFYLPQIERTVKRAGRKLTSYVPLFAGYIFLRRVPGLEILWRSNVVASLIEVPDQNQLAMELRQIRELQQKGALFTPVSEIAPGDSVRITEGAFQDYFGTVVSERGTERLIISVSSLRQAVAVEFPRDVVVKAHASQRRRRA